MIEAEITIEHWALIVPFRIARDSIDEIPLIHLTLRDAEGTTGHAEAAGVDYHGETTASMAAQIGSVNSRFHDRIDGAELLQLLPSGGARNALDCALWDLRAKQSGVRAWQAAGLPAPRPLLTAFTLGLGSEEETRQKAREALRYPLIKLKVDATRHLDIVRIVRQGAPAGANHRRRQ